ncbi:MAG: hypothetical protein JRI23_02475, partial [Deltaproteobacteria bacterium]|nr:hypothetical protein [Deltaproteobacteria bacterium]MBW2530360.1 hypothetical protein [Deltaproteobacteria bacterium]
MKLEAIDRRLRRHGAVLVDPRVLRRVLKAHRDIVGLQVPHTHCYGLERDALLALVSASDLGVAAEELPAEVVLVARPPPAEVSKSREHDLLGRLWRVIFHGKIHLALERRAREGQLDDTTVRRRIDAIGRVEFDEIRTILKSDDRVLPPADGREHYAEFVALYLELKHFAPDLLTTTFPGLGDLERVDAVIAIDVDAHALL